MNDEMYRVGGNDRLNLPSPAIARRKRLMVDLNAFDAQHGISITQKAKYTIPNWILILACLPPNDTGESRSLNEIHSIITDLEWDISKSSLEITFRSLATRSPSEFLKLSRIIQKALALVNGINGVRIVEDGKSCMGYFLNIPLQKLQKLVDDKKFVTYSFNLNDNNAVRLLGI